MSENQIIIKNLSKVYKNGFNALKTINLNIRPEESDTTIEALMTKYVSEIITEP